MRLKNKLNEMSLEDLFELSERLNEQLSDLLRSELKAYYVVQRNTKRSDAVRVSVKFNDSNMIEIFRFEKAVLILRR